MNHRFFVLEQSIDIIRDLHWSYAAINPPREILIIALRLIFRPSTFPREKPPWLLYYSLWIKVVLAVQSGQTVRFGENFEHFSMRRNSEKKSTTSKARKRLILHHNNCKILLNCECYWQYKNVWLITCQPSFFFKRNRFVNFFNKYECFQHFVYFLKIVYF